MQQKSVFGEQSDLSLAFRAYSPAFTIFISNNIIGFKNSTTGAFNLNGINIVLHDATSLMIYLSYREGTCIQLKVKRKPIASITQSSTNVCAKRADLERRRTLISYSTNLSHVLLPCSYLKPLEQQAKCIILFHLCLSVFIRGNAFIHLRKCTFSICVNLWLRLSAN